MLFICCCHTTPGWLDSNDVCMSGGSRACGGCTTEGRGHCGHSRWGNASHHLTVGPPPLYPHTHVMSEIFIILVTSEISNCLVPSTNCSISRRHYSSSCHQNDQVPLLSAIVLQYWSSENHWTVFVVSQKALLNDSITMTLYFFLVGSFALTI